jgi:creatinine amidohydrolase
MDRIPEDAATPLNRMKDLPPTYTGIWWYSDYPDHYAGDARFATREKGQALVRLMADCLAHYIAAVKADEVVPALTEEFFRLVRQVSNNV